MAKAIKEYGANARHAYVVNGGADFELNTEANSCRLIHLNVEHGWVDLKIFTKLPFETREEVFNKPCLLEKKDVGKMTINELITLAMTV